MCSRMTNITWFYRSTNAKFELGFIEASVTTHLVYQTNGYKEEQTRTWLLFVGFIDFMSRKEGKKGSIDNTQSKLRFSEREQINLSYENTEAQHRPTHTHTNICTHVGAHTNPWWHSHKKQAWMPWTFSDILSLGKSNVYQLQHRQDGKHITAGYGIYMHPLSFKLNSKNSLKRVQVVTQIWGSCMIKWHAASCYGKKSLTRESRL